MTPLETARSLTPSGRANLRALPESVGVWLTCSEMMFATGWGMTILYSLHDPKLCERRWSRWKADKIHGRKRGEGYEYSITRRGVDVRKLLENIP